MTNNILRVLSEELQQEADVRINHAMHLYKTCDKELRRLVNYHTGIKADATLEDIRETFDTLDLIDELDDVILNMETNLRLRGVYITL